MFQKQIAQGTVPQKPLQINTEPPCEIPAHGIFSTAKDAKHAKVQALTMFRGLLVCANEGAAGLFGWIAKVQKVRTDTCITCI
jgi:hypothetical protein